jgi:hypothetical protein
MNPGVPQSWNRYAYALNRPLGRLDPDGQVSVDFVVWTVKAAMWAHSFLGGFSDALPNALPTPPRPSVASKSAYQAGYATADFMATHDLAVEASITVDPGVGNDVTAGVSIVNGSEAYVFVGGGYSISMASVSGTVSIGVVNNYRGTGSAGGFQASVSGPQPVGLTFSGNPLKPNGTVTMALSVSTDVGIATQNVQYSVPVTSLSEELKQKLLKGGYVFIQGQLYRISQSK